VAENLGNLAQSTLNTSVIAGVTAWVINNPTSGPPYPAVNFRVRLGTATTGEIVLVTAAVDNLNGTSNWTVTRGQESTIQHIVTKTGLDNYLAQGWSPKATITAVKIANYTAVVWDFVRCNTTAGGFTVTLPTAVGLDGKSITVKKVSSDGNLLTVATTASQTIDGSLTQFWADPETSLTVTSDGSNWQIT
jgi:hypothetical protein